MLKRPKISKTLRKGILLFLLILLIEYLVIPELTGFSQNLYLLKKVKLNYLILGIILEGFSLFAYARLEKAVLTEPKLNLFTISRIQLSTLALSHIVPGGSAAGTSLGYKLLVDNGVNGSDAGFAVATQGMGSALVLNLLLWLSLLISIPEHGFNPLYWLAALAGLILIASFAVLILLFTTRKDLAERAIIWLTNKISFLDQIQLKNIIEKVSFRLKEFSRDKNLMLRTSGWAGANWVLDAASLWTFVAAFGKNEQPINLMVAYGLAYVLSVIPITPGGLGVVEGVLVPFLVGFGTPKGIAILGVLSYRLINFWLPIPLGAIAYLSLKVPGASKHRKAQELDRLANTYTHKKNRG